MALKYICRGTLKNGKNCETIVKKENIEKGIYYCGRHIKQKSDESLKVEEIEKIENKKNDEDKQKKSLSLILCLKNKDSSNIICNFLKSYAKYHNLNYNKLDLNNSENLIKDIENYIKDYRNVLIYYTGNGFNNCGSLNDLINNVFDFPSFKLKKDIFDQHDLMEYFVSDWDKKIICIFDCDNSEQCKYKENIDSDCKKDFKNCKKDFKNCNQEINIFNTINYSIKICSASKNKKNESLGLFTLNLFKNIENDLIKTLNKLKNKFSLLYDEYKDIPKDY